MNKIYKIAFSLLLATGALTSCSNEGLGNDGEGQLNLTASLDNDVKVVTRATGEDIEALTQDFRLYIYSHRGLIRKYHSQDELPTDGLMLISGDYEADLWAGDSTAASYTHKYFKGKEKFTISKGSVENINVVGKIQNTVASVIFPEALKEALTDVKMTIGTSAGTLDFTYDNATDAKGYYMLPENEATLTWTLTGTMANGQQMSKTGTVENAKAATEYQFTIKYNPTSTGEIGGGAITVTVDESVIEVTENITLTAAPKITGSGFDLSQPVYSSSGNFASKVTVYVTAAAQLSNIKITCDNSTQWETATGVTGSSSVDLLTANASVLAQLKTAGLYIPASTDQEGQGCGYDSDKDQDIEKVIFSKDLLNKLANGSYNFTIQATDVTGKTRVATLAIEISDALVQTSDATGVRQVSATLVGNIAKETATGFGFDYRVSGGSWTTVTDVTSDGSTFTATVTGLTPGTTYEYRAICDGFVSNTVKTFTTVANFQIPNAGFEEWSGSSPLLIYTGDESNMFWDSGNHGSATMNKNVTTYDATYKHSGNYSAKLASQFVGLGSIGKFAAGNLFAGKYLKTVGTNGIIGFGRPFTQDDGPRPTKLRGWVKYNCGTVDYAGGSVSKGDPDVGIVYIAMASGLMPSGDYTDYVKVVNTSTKDLFDKNASNIMGYGDIEWNTSTSGDGLIEFEIPINYTQSGMPKYIVIVASASKYGDYFAGSTQSTMWLDDLELVYE